MLRFPDGFLWGVATSAHQIEGAFCEDGRGPSIWDTMEAIPGRIADGSDASAACDHYHRWRADIGLMARLGVNAYRFSVAWSRVLPDGRGAVNAAGLDFYDRLVDALVEAGIRPFITLYHWDLPQALQDEGGWMSRDTADAFVNYADVVSARLGDRVQHWVTHNEPWCIAHLGHDSGHHAPGIKDPPGALRVAHHLLLSHGLAVPVIRRNAPGVQVGIVLNLTPSSPASQSPEDVDASRWFDGFFNRWYLDPLFRARYPEDVIKDRIAVGHLESAQLPFVRPGDLTAISAPMDFLGVNYYSRVVMRAGDGAWPQSVPQVPEEELTDMGWEVCPSGLTALLERLHREYAPPPMYITENGAAYSDGPDETGRIKDTRRIEFMRGHIVACHRAIQDGVPLRGYFAWSLMDNFEWAHGYEKRFGLFWVDYKTQERIPKDSSFWYHDVVTANGVDDSTS
ncbi:MAG: GH1 family beta-glucosidase [Candidatus Krumholzibacteria bacterium]|nr:GH1 family beta-glucosidase [Candidatus Krumholzibacteria bacterium]MDH4335665.1 GH1 family beta-glucosidase [Candidatus Krumholzibacteria bacterium]MDH5270440.1 GH1 family beta-glucosidase [Candidatus Krumholzibacteria bacterium]MDH5626853.1 GH1 family beta-glucosidase [Candidatus Krumholzibacteria bacterium]